MKRKIALLLATAMIMSMLSVNTFAAAVVSPSKGIGVVPNKTLFIEEGWATKYQVGTDLAAAEDPTIPQGSGRVIMNQLQNGTRSGAITNNGTTIEYEVDGTDLIISLRDKVREGEAVTLSLSNAEWFFRNNGASEGTPGVGAGTANYTFPVAMARRLFTASRTSGAALGVIDSRVTTAISELQSATTLPTVDTDYSFNYSKSMTPSASGLPHRAIPRINYDPGYGYYTGGANGVYLRYGVDGTTDRNFATTKSNELVYAMAVSPIDKKRATLFVLEETGSDGRKLADTGDTTKPYAEIRIPMVVRSTSADVVRLTIESGISAIPPNTFRIAEAGAVLTKASVDDPQIARNSFRINRLVFRENRLGSIATNYGGALGNSSKIQILAPSGFEWKDPKLAETAESTVSVGVEYGLRWGYTTGGSPSDPGYVAPGRTGLGVPGTLSTTPATAGQILDGDYHVDWKRSYTYTNPLGLVYNEYDNTVIEVTLNDIMPSTDVFGTLYINNLWLYAEDNAPWGDFNLSVVNVDSTRKVVTDETAVKGGTRQDWVVSLTTEGTIPELVTGRYQRDDSVSVAHGMLNAEDTIHKTARISFRENASAAWWSTRQTELTLSEGVKFRKVRFAETTELPATDKAVLLENTSNVSNLGGVNTALPAGTFINDGNRYNKVTVDGNRLILSDISVNANKRGGFKLDAWVSIESGKTGDITLTAVGTSLSSEQTPSVIIAKAIDPVTISTKVTDLKIGYQYQRTADIEITETKAGALLRNKQLLVTISDLTSTDMLITPDAKVEVLTENGGDLRISNITTFTNGYASRSGSSLYGVGTSNNTGGTIGFTIDRISSKPSTIKISNVSVKVDRTIPETNERPYKVIAWGTAVAENYGTNRDKFQTPGIMTDYVKVISSANDRSSILTAEVRVAIGEAYYTINGVAVDMDAAAYISPVSNSTMVPVRFVANAFGIGDESIIWDDATKTATIVHSTTGIVVQYTKDDPQMKINGSQVTMVSPDNLLVSPEISGEPGRERLYIPFRALGTAFGIPVAWDGTTNTAIYNEGANVTNNTASNTGNNGQ